MSTTEIMHPVFVDRYVFRTICDTPMRSNIIFFGIISIEASMRSKGYKRDRETKN